jgi:hypothetical protein
VPYALKAKVDAELKRLESEGIVEKVTLSDRAKSESVEILRLQ